MLQTPNSPEHGHRMTSPPSLGRARDYPRAHNAWSGGESDLRDRTVTSKGMTGVGPLKLGGRNPDRTSNSR